MENNLSLQMILSHLEVSLIPWLIVTILSLGLGYGLATLLRHWFQDRQHAFNYLVLLPWRSVATWIALVAVFSPMMIRQFGLEQLAGSMIVGDPVAGIILVSVALAAFMIPWMTTTFIRTWFPLNRIGKVLSVVRMAAVLSITLQVFLYMGIGYFLWVSSANLEMQKVIQGYEILGAILVGVDLGLGVVQFLVSTRQNRQSNSQKNVSLHENIG